MPKELGGHVVKALVIVQCRVVVDGGGCMRDEVGMYRVMGSFVCGGCMGPVTGVGCAGVGVGDNANLELVDKFCCLGGMLGVDRNAGVDVETGVRVGWNGFRQLVLLFAIGVCH